MRFICVCLLMEAVRTCSSSSRLSLTNHILGLIELQTRLQNQNTHKWRNIGSELTLRNRIGQFTVAEMAGAVTDPALRFVNRSPLCLTHASLFLCLQKNLTASGSSTYSSCNSYISPSPSLCC